MSEKLTQIQLSMTSEERMHIETAANVAGEEVHDWCLQVLVAAGHAQRAGRMPKAAMEWGKKFEALGVVDQPNLPARPNPSPGMMVGYEIPGGTYRVGDEIQLGRKLSAAEIAAKFGIKTGATIEEVEPFVETGLPGSLGPDASRESLPGASDSQTQNPDDVQRNTFIVLYGRQAWDRAIRIPSFKKASWDQRFEMAREQRDASGA